MIFQDSQSSLNPTKTDRRAGRRAGPPAPWRVERARRATARSRCSNSSACRSRASASDDYPTSALGRAAPARDDRDRARLRAEGADRRRADDRARRHDPGPDPARCCDDLEQRLGMATLLVTHDMGVVAGRTDRINVMYAGRIVETRRAPSSSSRACATPTRRRCSARSRGSSRIATKPLVHDPGPAAGARRRRRRAAASLRAARAQPTSAATQEPPLAGEDPSHLFACWHPVDGPVERLRIAPRTASTNGHRSVSAGAACSSIQNVVREYPVTGGLRAQTQGRLGQGGLGRHAARRRRRDAGAGRRVGVRQDDARQARRRRSRSPTAARSSSTGKRGFRRMRGAPCAARGATCR